jgi:hypothetical protein
LNTLTAIGDACLDPVSQAWMGHALAASGNRLAAQAIATHLTTEERRFVPPFHLAILSAGLGNLDAAFRQLDRACDARDPSLDTVAVEPRFQPLHGDRRYATLLDRLKLRPLAVA